ncbi:MAG: hypothetical protein GTO02_20295, partial [Candidatus Dadabacteria bacterium]|nr:hypothetical protein [Candidatus Dadabacteria bacterium]
LPGSIIGVCFPEQKIKDSNGKTVKQESAAFIDPVVYGDSLATLLVVFHELGH